MEEAAKRIAREKELAKVSIKKEDVELIVKEMEISKDKAERTLREHAGNIVEALASLTNWIKWIIEQVFDIFQFYLTLDRNPLKMIIVRASDR